MSEKPISPLRRRMIEDMTVRNFVEKTHNDYNQRCNDGHRPPGYPVESGQRLHHADCFDGEEAFSASTVVTKRLP